MKASKAIKALLVCAVMAFAGATPASAQLGNILKKAQKTLESVNNTLDKVSGEGGEGGTEVAIPSGGTMVNPMAAAAQVELVGAYGTSTSENYGRVYLVLKVKMIANENRIGFGGSMNGAKTMAIDQDGNQYTTGTMGQYYRDVTEGIEMKVTLDDQYGPFDDVKKTAKTMQVIKLACYINAQNRGMITFKNVPVQWDVQPQ